MERDDPDRDYLRDSYRESEGSDRSCDFLLKRGSKPLHHNGRNYGPLDRNYEDCGNVRACGAAVPAAPSAAALPVPGTSHGV